MEIKLIYGLFGGFVALVLVSTGILYLIFSPNPVAKAWYQATDTATELIIAAVQSRPDLATDQRSVNQSLANADNNQQIPVDITPAENEPTAEQVLGSQSSPSNNQPVANTVIMSAMPEYKLDQLYRFINAHRQENKLSKLAVNLALERSARAKVIDMIQDDYWRHENTSGEPTWQFLKNAGYQYELAGENLSFGHNTAWQTFEGWLNSPEHNAQMLSTEFEDMGAAFDCTTYTKSGQPSCIVVLHLGKPV